MRVSIDIVEEYKTTVLGHYRQEKERNEKKRYTQLDWDVNMSATRLSRGTPHLNSHRVGLGHQPE